MQQNTEMTEQNIDEFSKRLLEELSQKSYTEILEVIELICGHIHSTAYGRGYDRGKKDILDIINKADLLDKWAEREARGI